MPSKNFFGSFLNYETWQDAINLLGLQTQSKSNNKHFNTLSMYVYESLHDSIEIVKTRDYYDGKIANNLFYALEEEFKIDVYVKPKDGLILREWTLFRYPMRVLYYSVGLYLLKLTQEFHIDEFKKRISFIQSYYGGAIRYDNDKIVLNSNHIYFRSYYQSFRDNIHKQTLKDRDNKVVLRLDVENYFYNLPMNNLLSIIDSHVKKSTKELLSYNTETIEEIEFFFKFIMKNNRGIPVTDNDIISAYIAHLNLSFADLEIDDIINNFKDVLSHSIIRYMDDYYIIMDVRDDLSRRQRAQIVSMIASGISDMFHKSFMLTLNDKTEVYWLNDENDRNRLRSNLKRVSKGLPIPVMDEEEKEKVVQDKVDLLLKEIERIKKLDEKCIFEKSVYAEDEILKLIYDERVGQMLNKKENAEKLSQLFVGFNFNLVKICPTELIILISKDNISIQKFKEFLLSIPNFNNDDFNLALSLLGQTNFSDLDLINKIKEDVKHASMFLEIENPAIKIDKPGYFDLNKYQVSKLVMMDNVIEQAKFRVYAERSGHYSLALNHLLNEVHALCHNLDANKVNQSNYNADKVVQFLIDRKLKNKYITEIKNLFDRRNMNQVSHAGSEQYKTLGVVKSEYEHYRLAVSECFNHLLS
jgi:AbiA family abortive infection protein